VELEPVTRSTVSDAVFGQVLAQIVDGRLVAGDPLPGERALAEALGVNRQAVREALKRLEQANLVTIAQGGATRVRDYRSTAGLELLPRLVFDASHAIDVAVLRSVLELRACVGPDAARLAAQRGLPTHAEELDHLVGEMAALVAAAAVPTSATVVALSAADWRFWEVIIDASDNIAYRLAFNSLRDGTAELAELQRQVFAVELTDVAGHRAVSTAIARARPQRAEAAARTLVRGGLDAVVRLVAVAGAPRAARTARTARMTKEPTR